MELRVILQSQPAWNGSKFTQDCPGPGVSTRKRLGGSVGPCKEPRGLREITELPTSFQPQLPHLQNGDHASATLAE